MTVSPDLQALVAVVDAARQHVGADLIAVWLFGSAVHGGLRPGSDLDVLLVVRRPLALDQRRALAASWLRLSGPPGSSTRPLELTGIAVDAVRPWRHPPQRDLQLGEWLREEIEAGQLARPQPDPDLTLLLAQARQRSRPLFGPAADGVLDPVPLGDVRQALRESLPQWLAGWRGDERNSLLALSRIWLTAATGGFDSKDAAAGWVMERVAAPQRSVLAAARGEYLGDDRVDWTARQGEVEAALGALAAGIARALSAR